MKFVVTRVIDESGTMEPEGIFDNLEEACGYLMLNKVWGIEYQYMEPGSILTHTFKYDIESSINSAEGTLHGATLTVVTKLPGDIYPKTDIYHIIST